CAGDLNVKDMLALAALVLFAGPSISYLQYQRPVQLSGAGQHYITVDETVWKHSRPIWAIFVFMRDRQKPPMLWLRNVVPSSASARRYQYCNNPPWQLKRSF